MRSDYWDKPAFETVRPRRMTAPIVFNSSHSGRHYPEPVHLAPAYMHLGYAAGAFPVAEQVAREGLSLPMFPGISETQLTAVADAIRAYFSRGD